MTSSQVEVERIKVTTPRQSRFRLGDEEEERMSRSVW